MALTKVSTDGVKDDAITKSKIPANQIEASELADNAVDTNAIATDAVTTAKIADNAVDTNAIANDAVNGNKIADGAVGGAAILDNAIGTAKIQDNAITLAKLPHGDGSNDGKFLRANNGADPTFETVNTDLVSDTTPQLGGDLDSNGNNIKITDGEELRVGDGNDMVLKHTGSTNQFQSESHRLIISGSAVTM